MVSVTLSSVFFVVSDLVLRDINGISDSERLKHEMHAWLDTCRYKVKAWQNTIESVHF